LLYNAFIAQIRANPKGKRMKKFALLLTLAALSAPAYAGQKLAQNQYGESMRCSYDGLSFDAVQDTDMLVANVNETYRNVFISVYLNAYPGSEDSINVTLRDGGSKVSAGLKISTVDNKCTASTALHLTLNGEDKVLECTIYRSRLAVKEKWANCDKL
jgi:hypothetical protein